MSAPALKFNIVSGCSAVGDVSERRRWRMQRGKRSGSNPVIGKGVLSTADGAVGCNRERACLKFNIVSGCSAVGSAPALGAGCRRFESCHSDQKETTIFDKKGVVSFCTLIFSLFSLRFSLKIVVSR